MPSKFDCQVCGATPAEKVIHRTSPKGEPFSGSCWDCMGGSSASTVSGKLTEALEGTDATTH